MSLDLSLTATDLMKSLGNENYVTITRTAAGTFDPVAGTSTGDTTTDLPAVGIVTRVDTKLIDGTRIKAADKMVLLDSGVTPIYTDLITFNSVDHTIVDIDEVNHAGVTQLWKIICRG